MASRAIVLAVHAFTLPSFGMYSNASHRIRTPSREQFSEGEMPVPPACGIVLLHFLEQDTIDQC